MVTFSRSWAGKDATPWYSFPRQVFECSDGMVPAELTRRSPGPTARRIQMSEGVPIEEENEYPRCIYREPRTAKNPPHQVSSSSCICQDLKRKECFDWWPTSTLWLMYVLLEERCNLSLVKSTPISLAKRIVHTVKKNAFLVTTRRFKSVNYLMD